MTTKARKKTASKPGGAEPAIAAVPDLNDTIASNRAVDFLPDEEVSRPPAAYKPTGIEVRRLRLRVVADALHAEFLKALNEVARKPAATLRADLGEFAPDTSSLPRVISRIEGLDASIRTLESTLDAYRELRAIAVSDGKVVLDKAHDQIGKRCDDLPQLPLQYAHTEAFYTQIGDSISQGVRSARLNKPKEGSGEG